jgi:hypothetical protein
MRLPVQRVLSTPGSGRLPAAAICAGKGITPQGVLPSSCCDGNVTITSPQGQVLYNGTSGCCYDAGQAYCYPCSGEQQSWENYAVSHFSACTGTPPCSINLGGCGKLTPYC